MLKQIYLLLKKINAKGATAIEYALIASLIAVIAIAGMRMIGNSIKTKFNAISDEINAAGNEKP